MKGNKILVVDDDQDFSQLLAVDLKRSGYQVDLASDGEEGLEKIKTEKPDLVVLDIKMPKMDGFTLVRRLKKDSETKAIPLIVFTSYEPMKDMFELEGVSDYFIKSVNMGDLRRTIDKYLKTGKPACPSP